MHSIHTKEEGKGRPGEEVDAEDTEEDITVTIDLSDTKASRDNPVIAQISSILDQFDKQAERKRHLREVDSKLVCEVCDQVFASKKDVGEHVQSAHGQ